MQLPRLCSLVPAIELALISTMRSGGRRSPSGRCCGRPALQAVVAGLREDFDLSRKELHWKHMPRFQEWEAIRAANRRQKVHEVRHLMRRRNRFTFMIVWLPCTRGRFCCKMQDATVGKYCAHVGLPVLYMD